MTLNILRVRLIQVTFLILSSIVFFTTLYSMFNLPWYCMLICIPIGGVITAHLCTFALTINSTKYPSENFFALFVMTEEERQRFFHIAEKRPEYRKNFGIYRLTGYKLKELK